MIKHQKKIKEFQEKLKSLNSAEYIDTDYPPFSTPEEIEVGTKLNIRQLVEAAHLMPIDGTALFVCTSATLFQLAALRKKASLIVATDFDPAAVKMLRDWFEGKPHHDWSVYLKYMLMIEGRDDSDLELLKMEEELRDLYRRGTIILTTFDVYNPGSLLERYQNEKFDQVYSLWGIDATTDSEEIFWGEAFKNLVGKLKKKGLLVMAIIRNAKIWDDGVQHYNCVPLTAEKISEVVKSRFGAKRVQYKIHLFDKIGREIWKYDGDDYLFISFDNKSSIKDGVVEDELITESDDWSQYRVVTSS